MTDFVLRSLARQPARYLVRPSVAFVLAVGLAYAGSAWMVVLHAAGGGVEHNEPGLLVHVLRDGTLALPLVFAAVWCGLLLARRLVADAGAHDHRALAVCVMASCVALAVAVLSAAMAPVHASLFGAHQAGHEMSFALHFGRDTLLALVVDLPLAAGLCAGLLKHDARAWAAPVVERWRAPMTTRTRYGIRVAVCLVLVAPVLLVGQQKAQFAVAEAAPGVPCPTGAPLRTYAVSAIRVDIPLNRFGDHDPQGWMYVLDSEIPAVRAQEQSKHVQIGLRDDPIQPLVIRANLGDCVQLTFTNRAGGDVGMHVDGLSYGVGSSGDAIGDNVASTATNGETRTYRYYVPEDKRLEGNHYLRPGPGMRTAVNHGLFGSLTIEPKGSTYLHPDTRQPISSGWEAIIQPANGKSFREYVNIYHEIGDEDERTPVDRAGVSLPRVDPTTTSYRPGARAMNYRSEPFLRRLERDGQQKAQAYNSYTFGDPATPIPRAYLADPAKIRILHAGNEVFHVFHLHGGGIRWRLDPVGDPTFSYADTGLNKKPITNRSPSSRLDSQSVGPGEAYNLEIEGGAGGVQQSAGDFLFHCHIVEHYVSGMWGFWRVFDTKQPDLAALPDRAAPPQAVASTGLVGRTMPDGSTLRAADLEAWITPQLPPRGVPLNSQDGAVWDWQIANSADGPLYVGAPADTSSWPNHTRPADKHKLAGFPGLREGDEPVGAQNRPKILFNPVNGRPAFPLLRTKVAQRPPFAGGGHSGAPWLGERGGQPKAPGSGPDPFAGRPDGICPSGAPTKTFDLLSVQRPIRVSPGGATDPNGKVFTLAEDADNVVSGSKEAEPLVIRANQGDCVELTLASRQADDLESPFSMTNLHVHDVQFDVQGSDGVGTGLQYGQSVRPYQLEDPALSAPAGRGSRTLTFSAVPAKFRPGVFVGVGVGTPEIEVGEIESVTPTTVTLKAQLTKDHATGHRAGTEFVQYSWFPDVQLDNVFFHDHVDGIHNWGHGLVGQFIVEPPGSTYHDPKTGNEIRSGAIADIRTNGSVVPGVLDGSFREVALTTIDGNPATDSTINLRATPLSERIAADPDPSLELSSYRHGDPNTPLPRAYKGDPIVVRSITASATIDGLRIAGHRFTREQGRTKGGSSSAGSFTDTVRSGVSEKWTALLEGGDGGVTAREGDHLYFNSVGRRFRQGAWGIIRVLGAGNADLMPLPGRTKPSSQQAEPVRTGGRPPVVTGAGEPCPTGIPRKTVAISAVDLPGGTPGRAAAFVPTADAAAIRSGAKAPTPLALHVAAGTCLDVDFTNDRRAIAPATVAPRASFHVGEAISTERSSGMNIGFGPEQTVASGQSRTYRFHVDTRRIGSSSIGDFGDLDSGAKGLYGVLVVAPSNATIHDPVTGAPTAVGTAVDVKTPDGRGYRDFTAVFADDEEIIGSDTMPYPRDVAGAALLNYTAAPRAETAAAFSSRANGDPPTPLLRAYAGDRVRVHAMVAPGSEQPHVVSVGGHAWPGDPELPDGLLKSAQGATTWETFDFDLEGGAGGWARTVGDAFYGDLRAPFTTVGQWGLFRVLSDPNCPIRPLPGGTCVGEGPLLPPPAPPGEAPTGAAAAPTASAPAASEPTAASSSGSSSAGAAQRLPVGRPSLRVVRRMKLSVLRRSGLTVRLVLPANSRVVDVRLLTKRGKRTGVAGILATRRGGALVLRFRPKGRAVQRLRRGEFVLTVRPGPSRGRLGRLVLRAPLTLR